MTPLAHSVLATLFVSAIALVGIVFVFTRQPSRRTDLVLLSFAAGVLLATTFLELLPEATTLARAPGNIFVATLVAMIGFFLLERLLHGFHVHDDEHDPTSPPYLILIGDGLHNFIDGVAIAASFAASPELGLVTTLAVAVHEVPQELADFGILVSSGMTTRRALLLNFLSGLTAVVGAVVFFAGGVAVEPYVAWCMAATAGMFLYIASADLIPQLHHHPTLHPWTQLPFLGGILLIAALHLLV